MALGHGLCLWLLIIPLSDFPFFWLIIIWLIPICAQTHSTSSKKKKCVRIGMCAWSMSAQFACRCVRVKSTQTTRGVPRAAHPPDASKHRLKWVTTPLCVERRALPVPFVLRATAAKGPETPPCTRVAIITDPPEAKGRPPASPGVTTSTQASSGRTEWMAIADEINGTAGRHC